MFDLITETHDREVNCEATNVTDLASLGDGFFMAYFSDDSRMIINGNLFRTVTLSVKEN